MRHQQRIFFAPSDGEPESQILPEDELDQLFLTQLPRLEPPSALIAQILSAAQFSSQPSLARNSTDGPVARNSLAMMNGRSKPC